MSYIFGGNTGMSYDDLQRKRKIAEQMMTVNGTPRSFGEGLSTFAGSIAGALLDKRFGREEERQRAESDAAWGDLFGGGGYYGSKSNTTFEPMTEGESVANDAMVALGRRSPYADAIAAVESRGSGDYSAVGPETGKGRAYGRYQVMDFNIGPWTEKYYGQRLSPEEFLNSPQAQDAVFNGEFGSYVEKYGNPQDAASMWFSGRPMAAAGNASDGYTTVPEYVQKFTGALGEGRMSAQNQPTPSINAIVRAMSDPYIRQDPGKMAVLNALMQRAMTPPDPLRDLQIRKAQAEVNAMENPQPDMTSLQRDYQFAVQNGFQGSFMDYQTAIKKAGAPSVSTTVVGNAPDARPMADKPPKGYQRRWDAEKQTWVDEPIPGSEVATEQGQQETKIDLALADYDRKFNIVDGALDDAILQLEKSGRMVAGYGSMLSNMPESAARDFKATLETVKANLGFEELQNMRDNSPTGGALGQVTEREIAFLQAMQGNLDQAQSPKQLMATLQEIKKRRAEFRAERMRILGMTDAPENTGAEMPEDFADRYGDIAKEQGISIDQLWEAWPK